MPPLVERELAESIEYATDLGGTILKFMTIGIFLLSFIAGSSFVYIWMMIRSMQLIVFTFLVVTPTTGHTLMFFSKCGNIAQMDILEGKALYMSLFEFSASRPLNDNFETMGIQTKNFVYNSGSYFNLFLLIMVFNLSKIVLNRVAVMNS